MASLLGSGMAGMVARMVCHPIDTIKSKLQSGKPEYRRFIPTVSTTMTKEGIRGFFKGVGAVAIGGIPGVSIYLTSYDQTKRLLTKDGVPFFITSLSSGMIAEAIRFVCLLYSFPLSNLVKKYCLICYFYSLCLNNSCVVFVPVDVIKERMQVQSPISSSSISYSNKITYSSSLDALQKILKSEGLRGIY